MTLRIRRFSSAHWRVSIDNPPINLFDPELSHALSGLIDELESDQRVKVVVFDSANPDFFISHHDVTRVSELDFPAGPTGLSSWPACARRFELASFVSIGLVRGRARGVGSEFLQCLDMRFASRERAFFSQVEVGMGLVPGGGALERLPRLLGRARALEVIIGADDYDADTAERYGWINRAIPDSQLDSYVERLAQRIASFDRHAITAVKQAINRELGLPSSSELQASQTAFFELSRSPAAQQRLRDLKGRGLQRSDEFELGLGDLLGP